MDGEAQRNPAGVLRSSIRKDDLERAKKCIELLMEAGDWVALREHVPLDHRLLLYLAEQAIPSCLRMNLQWVGAPPAVFNLRPELLLCNTCRTKFTLNISGMRLQGEQSKEIFSQHLERLIWDAWKNKIHTGDVYLAGELANLIAVYSQRAFYSPCDCHGPCCEHQRKHFECAQCKHAIRNCERCKGTRIVHQLGASNLFATWVLLIKTWWPEHWYTYLADPKYGICLRNSSQRNFKKPKLSVSHVGKDKPGFITKNRADPISKIEWSDATYYSAIIYPDGQVKVGAKTPPLPQIPTNCICGGTKKCPYCEPTSEDFYCLWDSNGQPISDCLCKGRLLCPRCTGPQKEQLHEMMEEVVRRGFQRGR